METLFSWAAKTNLVSGVSAHRTSVQLFGNLRAARMHFALSGIDHLTRVTEELLGPPEELVAARTSVAGYLPFMSQVARAALVQSFANGNCTDGDLRLGHRASKLPGTQWLRYCASCAASDRIELGYSRWHVVHQLPSVWTCPSHAEELVELPGTSIAWQLPGDCEPPTGHVIPKGFQDVLAGLAAVSISAHRLGSVQTACLRDAALARCCEIGLAVNPRRLSAKELSDAFRKTRVGAWTACYKPLRLLATSEDWIASLLRGRTADHPVKWAIAWTFLWEGATKASSVKAFEQAASGQLPLPEGSQVELWPEARSAALKLYVGRIERALNASDTLEEACRTLGVTYQVLTRWLAANPNLRQSWLCRLRDERRSTAISRIEAYLLANPHADRKTVLKACNTDLCWLQRNDVAAAMTLIAPLTRQRRHSKLLFSRSQR